MYKDKINTIRKKLTKINNINAADDKQIKKIYINQRTDVIRSTRSHQRVCDGISQSC